MFISSLFRCDMSDGSGSINLRSIASRNGYAKFQLDGGDKYLYSYNPCVGYNTVQFDDLAVSTLSFHLNIIIRRFVNESGNINVNNTI